MGPLQLLKQKLAFTNIEEHLEIWMTYVAWYGALPSKTKEKPTFANTTEETLLSGIFLLLFYTLLLTTPFFKSTSNIKPWCPATHRWVSSLCSMHCKSDSSEPLYQKNQKHQSTTLTYLNFQFKIIFLLKTIKHQKVSEFNNSKPGISLRARDWAN